MALINAPSPPTPAGDTGSCWWDYFFGLSSFQSCLNQAGVAQIQSVADNAAKYYGPDSTTAQVAQQAATSQISQVPLDTATISSDYNLPSSPFYPSFAPGFNPLDPSTWPTWLWIALGIGGGVLVIKAVK